MEWSRRAELISKYRNAATLIIAGACALIMTVDDAGYGHVFRLRSTVRYFAFLFFIFAVVVAILFTIALVVAETKAAAKSRALPTAIAMPSKAAAKPIANPSVAADEAEPEPAAERAPGDGPSFLR